jgi:glycosyltransferase involved in cell wall biosynthesis
MKTIIDSYNDDRIKIIKLKQKSGAQAARNNGIKEAKADWIAFLDSDDEWFTNKIERQVAVLEDRGWNPYVVLHSDAILYDVVNNLKKPFGRKKTTGKDVFNELLQYPGPMFQAMFTSKQALETIGYLDENVSSYQEWDTAIGLAKICEYIYLDEPTFIYYLHSGETISKNLMRDIEGYEYILNKYENDIKNRCGKKIWYEHLKTQYKKCIRWGFNDKAKYYFKKMSFFERFNLILEDKKLFYHLRNIPWLHRMYKVFKSFLLS